MYGRCLRTGCSEEYLDLKRKEVTGRWRKLNNEDLHKLYSPLNIIRVIRSRRMRWEGHVPRMGDEKCIHLITLNT
jgi:hypothetical protein